MRKSSDDYPMDVFVGVLRQQKKKHVKGVLSNISCGGSTSKQHMLSI